MIKATYGDVRRAKLALRALTNVSLGVGSDGKPAAALGLPLKLCSRLSALQACWGALARQAETAMRGQGSRAAGWRHANAGGDCKQFDERLTRWSVRVGAGADRADFAAGGGAQVGWRVCCWKQGRGLWMRAGEGRRNGPASEKHRPGAGGPGAVFCAAIYSNCKRRICPELSVVLTYRGLRRFSQSCRCTQQNVRQNSLDFWLISCAV